MKRDCSGNVINYLAAAVLTLRKEVAAIQASIHEFHDLHSSSVRNDVLFVDVEARTPDSSRQNVSHDDIQFPGQVDDDFPATSACVSHGCDVEWIATRGLHWQLLPSVGTWYGGFQLPICRNTQAPNRKPETAYLPQLRSTEQEGTHRCLFAETPKHPTGTPGRLFAGTPKHRMGPKVNRNVGFERDEHGHADIFAQFTTEPEPKDAYELIHMAHNALKDAAFDWKPTLRYRTSKGEVGQLSVPLHHDMPPFSCLFTMLCNMCMLEKVLQDILG